LTILEEAVLPMKLGVKRGRGDEKIHVPFATPSLDHLINFARKSIPLAYLKITLQENALGADRYIVMKSVDDFSTGPFTGPKNGVGKTSHIMNVYNVW
jgi:hypothetical protein